MAKDRYENGDLVSCPIAREWDGHRQDTKEAMSKIETIHDMLSNITVHTQFLSKLEPISNNLESLAENNTKLIDVVSGKKQIPAFFGVGLLLLVGVLMVVLVVKETNTHVKVGSDGVIIGGGGNPGR